MTGMTWKFFIYHCRLKYFRFYIQTLFNSFIAQIFSWHMHLEKWISMMAFFTCIQSNIHENFNPKKFVIWVVQSFFWNTFSTGLFLLLFNLLFWSCHSFEVERSQRWRMFPSSSVWLRKKNIAFGLKFIMISKEKEYVFPLRNKLTCSGLSL